MNNDNNLSIWYSWPVIIIVFCIFWPIAIYLIVKRVSSDRKSALGSGKTIQRLSIASYCIAGIGFFACVTDGYTSDDIIGIIFFLIAGCVLQIISSRTKREADDIRKYLSIIINGNVRQLDSIASSVAKPYDVVKKDIQDLIAKGYLKNAYINEGTRELIFNFAPQNIPVSAPIQPQSTITGTAKVVSCKCCGANNTIIGQTGECEYCGSPLAKN